MEEQFTQLSSESNNIIMFTKTKPKTRLEQLIQWCEKYNFTSQEDPLLGQRLRNEIIQLLLQNRRPHEVNVKLTRSEEEVLTTFFENQMRAMCSKVCG